MAPVTRRWAAAALLASVLAGACSNPVDYCPPSDPDCDLSTIASERPPEPDPEPERSRDPGPRASPRDDPEPPRPAPVFELAILGGRCGTGECGYEPDHFFVYVGTIVKIRNRDAEIRSWVSDTYVFDSGPIEPGGTFRWRVKEAGDYYFHDRYAPYVIGRMVVVARE